MLIFINRHAELLADPLIVFALLGIRVSPNPPRLYSAGDPVPNPQPMQTADSAGSQRSAQRLCVMAPLAASITSSGPTGFAR